MTYLGLSTLAFALYIVGKSISSAKLARDLISSGALDVQIRIASFLGPWM